MSNSFSAKSTEVRGVQLKVQELSLSYQIVGNATPANVVVKIDDPSVLFIQTESTSASGSSDLDAKVQSGETFTHAASVDVNGEYSCMVEIQEKLKKVVSVEVRDRFTGEVIPSKAVSAPSSAIISVESAGDKDAIVFDVDHGGDITASTVDAVVTVKYVVE